MRDGPAEWDARRVQDAAELLDVVVIRMDVRQEGMLVGGLLLGHKCDLHSQFAFTATFADVFSDITSPLWKYRSKNPSLAPTMKESLIGARRAGCVPCDTVSVKKQRYIYAVLMI